MSLILSTTHKTKKRRRIVDISIEAKKRHGRNRISKRKARKEEIKNNQELAQVFDWMFGILKDLGYYELNKDKENKKFIQHEDARAGELLGISADMVKRYRIRHGYTPSARLMERLQYLEKLSKIEIKVTKFKRRRKIRASQNRNHSQCP